MICVRTVDTDVIVIAIAMFTLAVIWDRIKFASYTNQRSGS